MSGHEKDGFKACLFSRQDVKLINLKFFRGSDDLISEAALREEVCESEDRKRRGTLKAGAFPKCRKAAVDVRTLVAEM